MPSVFPGMDPFIEGYEWEDFHNRFITISSDFIVPALRPDYAVRIERRIYVEHPYDDPGLIRPALTIIRDPLRPGSWPHARSSSATLEPVERTLPGPVDIEETYLAIRHLESSEVITVIELLSPSNKRANAEGREEYLAKREEILQSKTNLVEIDLLRGGLRLPTVEQLPPGDFFAFVCRAKRRRKVDVYAWPLNHRLPTIPIPLATDDREVPLDLQAVFDTVYDRAGYDYTINYTRPIVPTLNESETFWAGELLKTQAGKAVS
jgi:hypothetical protein